MKKLFALVVFAAACSSSGHPLQTQSLADTVPGWDGSCPFEQVTSTHEYVIDSSGNVVSDVTKTCKVCLDKDGVTPLNDPTCDEVTNPPPPPPAPADPVCQKYDTIKDDPTGFDCWSCIEADGSVKDGCDFHKCDTDGKCADGSACDTSQWLCDAPTPPPPTDPAPSGDVCKSTDHLDSDPTGTNCVICYDATTGKETQEYCKDHP